MGACSPCTVTVTPWRPHSCQSDDLTPQCHLIGIRVKFHTEIWDTQPTHTAEPFQLFRPHPGCGDLTLHLSWSREPKGVAHANASTWQAKVLGRTLLLRLWESGQRPWRLVATWSRSQELNESPMAWLGGICASQLQATQVLCHPSEDEATGRQTTQGAGDQSPGRTQNEELTKSGDVGGAERP